ncbi:hypothetical protein TNIN_337881 [Trichonephila inaurata madagascariensis]|uniref:Uncharacterized protein n=1 Tax=Trichonephila inaurata madagascariensis TaxID=2747483 RepID=A0A8X7C1L4_9ARAC|nr:hypothetical protein TNIN_337881 [Trichonephila inaurata madagascariensis]
MGQDILTDIANIIDKIVSGHPNPEICSKSINHNYQVNLDSEIQAMANTSYSSLDSSIFRNQVTREQFRAVLGQNKIQIECTGVKALWEIERIRALHLVFFRKTKAAEN